MNFTKKGLLLMLGIAVLWGNGLLAQEQTKLSLQKAIQYAMDNNLEIRMARLEIEDAEQQIEEIKATGLPQINAEASLNRYLEIPVSVLPPAFEELIRIGNGGELPPDFSNQVAFALKNNFQAGVNLQQMVFDGSYFTGLKAARLSRDLVQDQLQAKEQEVRNQVIEAYLPALMVTENLRLLENNRQNITQLFNETKALYEEGFVEQLDVDRLELTLSNLETEQASLRRQYELVANTLRMILNYPEDTQLLLTDTMEDLLENVENVDLEEAINYNQRLDYRVTETALQLNELNIEYVKNTYLPSVSLNASYSQAFQGNELFGDPNSFWAPTAIVGLSARVPIFDGFGKRAKIERAKLDYEILRTQQNQLNKLITMEVKNARIQYRDARQRLKSQQKNMELAERIYETTQIKYREGVGSSLEITQAEQSLFDVQGNYTRALFDLLQAKLALDKALGK